MFKSNLLFLLVLLSFITEAKQSISKNMALNIFDDLVHEMRRLDGSALEVRKVRKSSFNEEVAKLRENISKQNSDLDFYLTFKKLDQLYTNLHARVMFNRDIQKSTSKYFSKTLEKKFNTIITTNGTKIYHNDKELISINDKKINEWLKENNNFCKKPLKSQCDLNFEKNLFNLVLSWDGSTPLKFKYADQSKSSPKLIQKSNRRYSGEEECSKDYKLRYPQFKMIHQGKYACLFENQNNPNTVLLRISSFYYERGQGKIRSVFDEVKGLIPYWHANSHKVDHLIIDLINNPGGNSPIPYFKLFIPQKFQSQLIKMKKTKEIENSIFRGQIFYHNPALEKQFMKFVQNKTWESMKYLDFSPSFPMFCANDRQACDESFHASFPHQFKGQVHLMMNSNCVSSCDGFVWTINDYLNAKNYGHFQAADSAFMRSRISFIKSPTSKKGYKMIHSSEMNQRSPEEILSQVIILSQAVDQNGNRRVGRPVGLDEFVEINSEKNYHREVLKTVINNIN